MDYKERLEKAKELYPTANADQRYVLERLFPELAESEDERTRKEILNVFKQLDEGTTICGRNYDYAKWIAWLEKQGGYSAMWKKNTVDNKPTLNHSVLIKNIHGIAEGEWNGKEWIQYRWSSTIKDGDVLQLGEVTAIFKKYIGQEKCICYCSVCEGEFEIPIENGEDNIYGCTNTTPATKEQRDLLFQKMNDAGYEWDAEKKELKLLVTNGGDFESENCEQKSAWSYEDEANLNNIIWLCNNCIKGSETTWIPAQAKKIKHLIETIKERGLLQQNPIEWSEEDDVRLQACLDTLQAKSLMGVVDTNMTKWLKSLKERIGG